jgi:Uncharacterized protein conserved in bacteria (DUF2125)
MTFIKLASGAFRPALCVSALLSSTAVYADVTAQQVWDDWKANMGVYGQAGMTIGSEVASGGTVTVTDLGIDSTMEGGSIKANMASLVLTENGDGTVSVTMSEDYPMTITNTTDGVETVISVGMHQTGMTMTVSGTPEEMTYDVAAAKYTFSLDSVMEAGTAIPAEVVLTLNNMAGSYVSTPGDLRNIDYEMGADSADVSVVVNDPETGTAVNFSGKMNDLATTANMAIPTGVTDPNAMFSAGMAMAGGYTFGASSFVFSASDPSTGDTSGTATAISGTTDFSFDMSAMGYDTTTQGLNMELTSASMPFPVKLAMSELGLGILFPLAKSTEPADWASYVNLTDLSVNDEIWAMLDAGNVLPHDPATVVMDLTGTATMLFDILDPAQQEQMNAGAAPGELNSVSINDLTVKIAGAEVLGTGAFTFDNTDMTTIPGMPRPEGSVDLKINGVNGLLDKLVSMGLVPEDQAMMPRMMMGMFATVVGDDQLTSKIEIDASGGIFANGQQIQ